MRWDLRIKIPPKDNCVEIAYFTFPGYEGRGYATEMAKALIRIAALEDEHVVITAQTMTEGNASTSILKKLGFSLAGTIEHPEDGNVWEWQLSRKDIPSRAR